MHVTKYATELGSSGSRFSSMTTILSRSNAVNLDTERRYRLDQNLWYLLKGLKEATDWMATNVGYCNHHSNSPKDPLTQYIA
jgi:hypothetical protein